MAKKTNQFACPVCGYDQRGLIASWADSCPLRGACSECGSAIDWQELHRPDLFEEIHYFEHPRSGSIRDLITTVRRVFLPGVLWAWVPRSQPLALRRLLMVSGVGTFIIALIAVLTMSLLGLGALYALYYSAPAANVAGLARSYDPLPYAWNYIKYEMYLNTSMWIIVLAFHSTTVLVAAAWALLARSRGVRLGHIARFALLTTIPLSVLIVFDSMFYTVEAVYWYDDYLGTGSVGWLGVILGIAYTDKIVAAVLLASLAWLWHAWVMFMMRYLQASRPRLTVLAYGLISLLLFPIVGGVLVMIVGVLLAIVG